jgi:hypothetical protein
VAPSTGQNVIENCTFTGGAKAIEVKYHRQLTGVEAVTETYSKPMPDPLEGVVLGQPSPHDRPDLYECDECSQKPGSPRLCDRCFAARAAADSKWIGPRWRYKP